MLQSTVSRTCLSTYGVVWQPPINNAKPASARRFSIYLEAKYIQYWNDLRSKKPMVTGIVSAEQRNMKNRIGPSDLNRKKPLPKQTQPLQTKAASTPSTVKSKSGSSITDAPVYRSTAQPLASNLGQSTSAIESPLGVGRRTPALAHPMLTESPKVGGAVPPMSEEGGWRTTEKARTRGRIGVFESRGFGPMTSKKGHRQVPSSPTGDPSTTSPARRRPSSTNERGRPTGGLRSNDTGGDTKVRRQKRSLT
ncbi:MAG: hypothetical protein AAFV29_04065, partial [Myxococcota bacterium]